MNSRKYPRTMAEAFGPYETGPIHDQVERMDLQDKLVVAASAIVTVTMLALIVWGVL
jgi:hypothetical protein